MTRRLAGLLLAFILLIPFVYATDNAAALVLDGETCAFTVRVMNGTTFIPLYDLGIAMGARVRISARGFLTTVERDGHMLRVSMSSKNCTADSGTITLTAYPFWHDGQVWMPVRPFAELFGYRLLYDDVEKTLYMTSGAKEVPEGVRIPTLMYHAVSDDIWGIEELFVKPAEFEKQLQYLTENGYDTITYEDLPRLSEYDKPVLLTFDDGYLDNYTIVYPLLRKYNCKATFFVVAGSMKNTRCMNAEQIRELADSGLVSIQSHSLSHPDMSALSESQLVTECGQSQLLITRVTGKVPFVLCYPMGKQNTLAREVTARYYDYGILMNGGTHKTNADTAYKWTRSYVARATSLARFKALLK